DGAAAGEAGGSDGGDELDETSRNAVAGAEAVLYVVAQGVRADDEQALAAFTAATASREAGPVNATAVLNKADTAAPESVADSGGDVCVAVPTLAGKQAELVKPRGADVLPIIGLVAETVEAGGFTQSDATALQQLAELEDSALGMMLISADIFT